MSQETEGQARWVGERRFASTGNVEAFLLQQPNLLWCLLTLSKNFEAFVYGVGLCNEVSEERDAAS